MKKLIDLSSDTATKPSLEMKTAMFSAELGDEQKGEDPTTEHLEKMVAELLGFEQAMFFPSATMANEVAIRLLCEPGEELIAAENAHIVTSESGGPAILAGVMLRQIPTKTGFFSAQDLHSVVRWSKGARHNTISKCISIENTTNLGGGLAWDLASLDAVLATAKELKLKTHLDGARIFNAAVKLGIPVNRITVGFDTVTICLSKGLGCPIGALLAFSKIHYEKVLRLKHLFGGAMRQSGILAAAGIFALKNNVQRLVDDHQLAEVFSEFLKSTTLPIEVELNPLSTNMVFFRWIGAQSALKEFHENCIAKGFRFSQIGQDRFRAVFHLDISRKDIDFVMEQLKEIERSYSKKSDRFKLKSKL